MVQQAYDPNAQFDCIDTELAAAHDRIAELEAEVELIRVAFDQRDKAEEEVERLRRLDNAVCEYLEAVAAESGQAIALARLRKAFDGEE